MFYRVVALTSYLSDFQDSRLRDQIVLQSRLIPIPRATLCESKLGRTEIDNIRIIHKVMNCIPLQIDLN